MIRIIIKRTRAAIRAIAALIARLRRAAERPRQDAAAAGAGQIAVSGPGSVMEAAQGELAPAGVGTQAAEAVRALSGRCPLPGLCRQVVLRGHLDRILAAPPPANHLDCLTGPDRDHAAADRQIDQVRILQLLYGCNEVAAAYRQWLDEALSEQAKTAAPLCSWDEIAIDSAPVGWGNRDVHGFLCERCGDTCWQVILADGFPDRLCARCVRRELALDPGQVWAPRLPPAHGHLEYPGLLPGEPHENSIDVRLTDGTTARYGLGDASPFLVRSYWGERMDLTASAIVSGEAGRPHMEISGSTRREEHRFSLFITLDFDPEPQGTRQAPYGYRYTAGALTCHGETRTVTDVFGLLDAIARGEAAFTPAPVTA